MSQRTGLQSAQALSLRERRNTHIVLDQEEYNQVTLELGRVHAQLNVLFTLQCTGDFESLERASLPAMLGQLEQQIAHVLERLVKGAKLKVDEGVRRG
jgi:hypothetical protein